MIGRVHSFQSLGTVDGPGVRFVVFFQGCPIRCGYCHNPDTWLPDGGQEVTVEDVMVRVRRCRSYFGKHGGITASGGEPLLQAPFVKSLFERCRAEGIHTCLDTSGAVWNEQVSALLDVTDRVLLDVKFTTEEEYERYTGGSLGSALRFLEEADARGIPVTVRQVVVPTLNDNAEYTASLMRLIAPYACVDGVELLPFRKLCQTKYDQLSIPFLFASYPEAGESLVRTLGEPYPLCTLR